MTDHAADRLAQIVARVDATTPGSWHNTTRPGVGSGMFRVLPEGYEHFVANEVAKVHTLDDATFVANAPDDIRWLASELARLGLTPTPTTPNQEQNR